MRRLRDVDPQIASLIDAETQRQQRGLELIASENFTSQAVLTALGSVLTSKYAEGYPGRRYYGGCEIVDQVETLAIQRAKDLFGAEHANVQPHSGSQANMEAYFSLLHQGETIMAMSLPHGGHLTHGSPVSFSGKLFKVAPYGVSRDTETIDYDALEREARIHQPKLIVAGASAYPRQFDFAAFKQIADSVGAYLMVDMAHFAGLVAARIHTDPVPYADVVTSTTHKTLRGPRGGLILSRKEHASSVDNAVFPFAQGGPLEHVIAAKAVCFHEAAQPAFREYALQVVRNAKALAAELMARGLRLVSNGTDNHLMLVDLSSWNITGKEAEKVLDGVGISVNKNAIPFDTRPPRVTSGIRIGTPAVTTRGMKETEMRAIAEVIAAVLANPSDEEVLAKARSSVDTIVNGFPLYD